MWKPKVDKWGENIYGNYDRNTDSTWKWGLDSGMVTCNANVPYEDTTGYVDEFYFDSEIEYLSCYAIGNPYQNKDKWMVDSGCTNHLTHFLLTLFHMKTTQEIVRQLMVTSCLFLNQEQ